MDDQLFTIEDKPNRYKYEPEPMTSSERLRKMSHTTDPGTSFLASAKTIKKATAKEKEVLAVFAEIYPEGISDGKLAVKMGVKSTVSGNSAVKRRSSLTRTKGLIRDSGEREINEDGNEVVVWVLAYPPKELGL